jgi:predicted metal-dependent phosphoesterase TrpH
MGNVFPASTSFDLHLHTTASDGRHPADVVIARCLAAGLGAIALTDHDLPVRAETTRVEGDGRSMWVIAGAELSGMYEGNELHLLCYFPGVVPEGFRTFCRERCVARAARYESGREQLPGEVVAADDAAHRGDRSLTRTHLARELVRTGQARDVREAFARFLGDTHHRVPAIGVSFVEVIAVARAHGAYTAWAHPPVALLDRALPGFVAAGLQGLEGDRPLVAREDRRRLRRAAEKHDLWLTAGSDWHGWGDDADLGLYRVEAARIRRFVDAFGGAVALTLPVE